LIVADQSRAVGFEQAARVIDASSWEREVLGKILRAPDDPRGTSGREPQLLALVELGVLEGSESAEA
jgi:hypothetical protein